MEEAYDDAFEYDWKRRGLDLIEDQTLQVETHMFPLSVIGNDIWELVKWLQDYASYWGDAAEQRDYAEARHSRAPFPKTPKRSVST